MSTVPIQLIVGLANPGSEYAHTRHNAGAWWVDRILEGTSARLKPNAKFQGSHATIQCEQFSCHVLVPHTFMNLSGVSVRAVCDYYHIEPNAILVAHDEIDLPVGDIRLKFSGGDGGHNGLKDIIRHLKTRDFHRLRIGVGRPEHSNQVVDYVLHAPGASERREIDGALDRAMEQLPRIASGFMQQAMNTLHQKGNA